MKLIKPSFEILKQQPGIEGIYKQIELSGRTCYKSHDKMTEDSAKGFVDRMIKSGHGGMLEHGTVYLAILDSLPGGFGGPASDKEADIINFYRNNKYSKVVDHYIGFGAYDTLITTNYRVLAENNRFEDLQYICEPTEFHKKRITVRFVTDQGILREFTRHRTFSFAVESTRRITMAA